MILDIIRIYEYNFYESHPHLVNCAALRILLQKFFINFEGIFFSLNPKLHNCILKFVLERGLEG